MRTNHLSQTNTNFFLAKDTSVDSFVDSTGHHLDLTESNKPLYQVWLFQQNVMAAYKPEFVKQTVAAVPAVKSLPERLAMVRQVLKIRVTELADLFAVSRQAVYKWLAGESLPDETKMRRILALERLAERIKNAGLGHVKHLIKMKHFDGRSLLDLIKADEETEAHVTELITSAQRMEAGYQKSAVTRSKTKPNDNWRTYLSIPAANEHLDQE